jgi:hypothetical protein
MFCSQMASVTFLVVPVLAVVLGSCGPANGDAAPAPLAPAAATESPAATLNAWPQAPRPTPPKTIVPLSDHERYAFQDSRLGRRLPRDVRAYLGDYRATYYYTDGLLSRQVVEGFNGYFELLSAPGGRRIYWGHRKHAGPTQYAILYDADGTLMAVAVRSFMSNAGMVVTLFLPEGRDGRIEEEIFRDWAQYMIAQRGQDDGTDVRIVRLPAD